MRYFLILFLISSVFTNCATDDGDPADPPRNDTVQDFITDYLVSSEELASYSSQDLSSMAQERGLGAFSFLVQYGVRVTKIHYRITIKGEEVVASALLMIPERLDAAPIVSVHHGTIFQHSEAPSFNYSANSNENAQNAELLGGIGFVTVVPDYVGFGSSTDQVHPYYNERASALTVRDAIAATIEYLQLNNVQFDSSLRLLGYSEGGFVTMAAAKEIERNPIPQLTIRATAAGAGGYNIPGTLDFILKDSVYSSPNYLGYVLWSYENTVDTSIEVSDYFQEPYADLVPFLYNGANSAGTVNNALSDSLARLLVPEKLAALRDQTEEQLLPVARENVVDDWSPATPVRLYHGTADNVVPVEESIASYERIRSRGGNIDLIQYEGETHSTTFQQMLTNVIPWFLEIE